MNLKFALAAFTALLFAFSFAAAQESQRADAIPADPSSDETAQHWSKSDDPIPAVEPQVEDPIIAVIPGAVASAPVTPEEPGNPNTNNPGSNNNNGGNNDEGSGRRLIPANNPALQQLGNTDNNPSANTQNTESQKYSGITGAVVGLFGERGALGVGIFFVVVGAAALLVYNRQRFGLVKAK